MKFSTLTRFFSGVFLLFSAWWFITTPNSLIEALNHDTGQLVDQLLSKLPNQYGDTITFAILQTIDSGELLVQIFTFRFYSLFFWLGDFAIGANILHSLLAETSVYQNVLGRAGKRTLARWTSLPFIFLLIDLITSYASSQVLSNFIPLESNPAVLALFGGNPYLYLANLTLGSFLILPALFGIFYAESKEIISIRIRKSLILLLSAPFIVGTASNIAAVLILR